MSTRRGRSEPKALPGVTRERIAERLARGLQRSEIARDLGLSKSTVSWHAAKLGCPRADKFAKRYDWVTIQAFYDEGHTPAECRARFGCDRSTWAAAVKDERLLLRPRKQSLCDLLVADRRCSRHTLKRRLLQDGVKTGRCDTCGIGAWRGRPIHLDLHHVNGDGFDNRLENLRLLCPNCHSQTSNFAGRAIAARQCNSV